MAKTDETSSTPRFTFYVGPDGGLEWMYPSLAPDLTTEQAAVVAQVRGMRDIARGLEAIADAIAEHTRVVAKAHGVTDD